MRTMQIQSRVGQDGVLSLRIALSPEDANAQVLVTVAPADRNGAAVPAWADFIRQTYGSCDGLGLEEPPDLPPEQPDESR